jgi:RNA polymerase sigma-70 factor (ECF subfamily)
VGLAERAASDDPFEEAARRLDRAVVERALGQLPAEQRVAIELVDIAGLTAKAAAELLGRPRGTVLARVHRGRRRLALLLDRAEVRDEP